MNDYTGIVQYLISIGANKEVKDNDGYTPLIWALRRGRINVIKYLISAGADKEAKDNSGKPAFSHASESTLNKLNQN